MIPDATRGEMEMIRTIVSPEVVRNLRRLLYARRNASSVYTSSIGGRYIPELEQIAEISKFVRDPKFEKFGRRLLGEIPLGYLSLAALEIRPGDSGLGAHHDYPHCGQDDSRNHLCVQFLLSIDGTSTTRAPLWIGSPENKVVLKPGELIVYGGNVIHGVHPNTSKQSRMSLLWSMGPTWIRPMNPAVSTWWCSP